MMRARLLAAAIGLTAGLAVLCAPTAVAAARSQPTTSVTVTLDRTEINAVIGQRITIRARVTNSGQAPTDRSIAHLNVASLSGTYVDLEDWTAGPTQAVSPIPPGSSALVSWDIQAVNAGSFDVYAVLLPNGPSSSGRGPVYASAPAHVTVTSRRTLNAGGSLPIVVAVPAVLGCVAVATRYRRRLRVGRT
jgi:hypothetical protein